MTLEFETQPDGSECAQHDGGWYLIEPTGSRACTARFTRGFNTVWPNIEGGYEAIESARAACEEHAAMEPRYVVFDTETTGLFVFKDKATGLPVPADDPCQPRLASFAAILADAEGNEIERVKHFIKPDGWTIDGTHAAEVNGLTDDFLSMNGVPVSDVLDIWASYVDRGLIVAAFNAAFDCKMMRAELRRAARPDRFEETRNTCLMRALSPYRDDGLPVNRGMVKLSAACDHFGIVNADAHDAMADAEAALAILKRLIADDRVIEPKVHYAKSVA